MGNGSNNYSLEPQLNEELEYLQKEEGREILKIDSVDEYSGALMKDGSLFVWGKNDRGQMGVGAGIGIDMVESENTPTEVEVRSPTGELLKVQDFTAGQNSMMIRTEDGGIYKTGQRLDYVPTKIKLMEEF